tara:strand:- start:2916 stop:3320 length:405 start_codon:yes stop_codon:yes gene_type:complete
MKWNRFKKIKKIISSYYNKLKSINYLYNKMQLYTGDTVYEGSGANYNVGLDKYPVKVTGWSESGKTVYLQPVRAYATNNHDYYAKQSYLYSVNSNTNIMLKATYRPLQKAYILTGTEYCHIDFSGYQKYQSPIV